jgi:methylenetetrahydrofolate reductase (NADPH)
VGIATILNQTKPILSFEIFPPKAVDGLNNIYDIINELKNLNPDFISVTCGTGEFSSNDSTFSISGIIKHNFGIEPLVHLTCHGTNKEYILNILNVLKNNRLTNILALRGDNNLENEQAGDFKYASDLITFIKKQGDFHISAACYPEGHISSSSIDDDIKHLKTKVDAGASHLISQLFFDNNIFYSFLESARAAGITVPIEAGIMPIVSKKQIEKMVKLSGAKLPQTFRKIMEKYEHSPVALREAGITYAIEQIVDLTSNNVDGIHIYTMNNPEITKRIIEYCWK